MAEIHVLAVGLDRLDYASTRPRLSSRSRCFSAPRSFTSCEGLTVVEAAASRKAKSDNVFGHPRSRSIVFRAGLYDRVSTNDQQTLAMQSWAMREYAARRGWTIALQVREVNSGAERREAREKVLEAARRREIYLVLVWRLDRWGRSVTDLLAPLQELEHLGVGFVSLTWT